MEFFEVVEKRYSHKAAFDRSIPVPEEHLLKMAQAGMAAPSGGNRQTPEFILVNDPAIMQRLGEITQNAPLQTAPAAIVIVSDVSQSVSGFNFYLEDYAAATENILLAATALGYCCGWIDAALRDPAVRDPICQLLGIPADRRLMVAIPIGKPAEPGARRRKKPFAQRASWNRYAIERQSG